MSPTSEDLSAGDTPQQPDSPKSDRPMHAVDPVLPENRPTGLPEPLADLPFPVQSQMDDPILGLLVNDQRVKRLWGRADRLQSEINRQVNSLKLAQDMIARIEKARSQMMEGRSNYEEAERLLSEVEHRLEFNQRVFKDSRSVGFGLFLYELFWLALLSAGFIAVNLTPLLARVYVVPPLDQVSVIQFINSLIWGSLGGVVGAFYALWKHIADQQDFDRQFSLWYLTNPVLGLALGAFVFLVIQAGFLSLTAGGSDGDAIRSASVIYVLAWIAGFKQNVVYELVRRILDVFRINPTEKEDSPTTSGPIQ